MSFFEVTVKVAVKVVNNASPFHALPTTAPTIALSSTNKLLALTSMYHTHLLPRRPHRPRPTSIS
jgi:hypothetical protein